MTALARIMSRRIAITGPISLADYMAECLLHPEHGYYTTRDAIGEQGDFTTAPEISQMFGELLGLCLAQAWIDQDSPTPFILAELGPGHGTLMADVLRTTANVPNMHAAMQVTLIEASPKMRALQRQKLQAYNVSWLDGICDLPQLPLFILANEFFDALPIRQFVRDAKGWHETQVGLDKENLTLGLSQSAPITALDHRLEDTKKGDIVEIRAAAEPILSEVSHRIAAHGGCAVIVDYGDWHSRGDTFQAVEKHQIVDPVARPGAADLTAHVDFEALANVAKIAGATASEMIDQGQLLARLGIEARAAALAQNLTGAALETHVAAFERLTCADKMGSLFKAIAIAPTSTKLPPGFDACALN